MIRMIILEMEETLVEVRASAARTIADQKEMRRHIIKLEGLQSSWTEKAELALSKGPRGSRQGPRSSNGRRPATWPCSSSAQLTVLDDALRASEADIAKLQTKLREARAASRA